ncbi:hypothetical protein ACFC6U_39575, partial [Kitasatospora purpeofusca]|uniref:hypothetical protein n=1 Tax=Kitasatospora purpeofusca TaxID=67352 RepID=UPI0035DD1CEA
MAMRPSEYWSRYEFSATAHVRTGHSARCTRLALGRTSGGGRAAARHPSPWATVSGRPAVAGR